MANLKQIRKRISTVKSTQKITRAMKMVAGARLNRAQARISALRPYAVKTGAVLASIAARTAHDESAEAHEVSEFEQGLAAEAPLLVRRAERTVLLLVVSSDRGLCGAFNSNVLKMAELERQRLVAEGKTVVLATIGRKARDFYKRRKIETLHHFAGVWERLELETARTVARVILKPFALGEVDTIKVVYNQFKSAMSQHIVAENLLPIEPRQGDASSEGFTFEPDRGALLTQLVPMYLEITLLRALYESMASELGARMTAMDSATKNASEMISKLTLVYNRARQAAITTELMEIIGGAEALNG